MELSNGYRFWQADRDGKPAKVIAVLDKDGTLHLKDERGSLEIHENWRFYVRDVMHIAAVKGNETDIVEQLSKSLGIPQPIDTAIKKYVTPGDHSGKEVNMATAKKT